MGEWVWFTIKENDLGSLEKWGVLSDLGRTTVSTSYAIKRENEITSFIEGESEYFFTCQYTV